MSQKYFLTQEDSGKVITELEGSRERMIKINDGENFKKTLNIFLKSMTCGNQTEVRDFLNDTRYSVSICTFLGAVPTTTGRISRGEQTTSKGNTESPEEDGKAKAPMCPKLKN